jgi:hypothetical protein
LMAAGLTDRLWSVEHIDPITDDQATSTKAV